MKTKKETILSVLLSVLAILVFVLTLKSWDIISEYTMIKNENRYLRGEVLYLHSRLSENDDRFFHIAVKEYGLKIVKP